MQNNERKRTVLNRFLTNNVTGPKTAAVCELRATAAAAPAGEEHRSSAALNIPLPHQERRAETREKVAAGD
jgi:hypothetical protein